MKKVWLLWVNYLLLRNKKYRACGSFLFANSGYTVHRNLHLLNPGQSRKD